VDPEFAASVSEGDILVAGRNFGCGSAMEIAATVILAAGIKAVVAQSFSRTFYRNAINNGLLPIACDTSEINEGDELAIQLAGDVATVTDMSNGAVVAGERLPPIMLAILSSGGLVGYMREHGSFRWA
jgi:3-isopropylmalate/(R)-2-methylmalate dehydratase small subunit